MMLKMIERMRDNMKKKKEKVTVQRVNSMLPSQLALNRKLWKKIKLIHQPMNKVNKSCPRKKSLKLFSQRLRESNRQLRKRKSQGRNRAMMINSFT